MNCLSSLFGFWFCFLACVASVNNCKVARPALGGDRLRHRELRTIDETARKYTSPTIYTMLTLRYWENSGREPIALNNMEANDRPVYLL